MSAAAPSSAATLSAVNHVLNRGTGKGIQAIVVYPMNALANSQAKELEKFLRRGYGKGQEPVTFARYTGQESGDEHKTILSRTACLTDKTKKLEYG